MELTNVVSPGDPAPDGGTFDFAAAPSINARGDVAFGAHVRGEECCVAFSAQLDADTLGTGNRDTGLYVWSHGALRVVARTGTNLPGLGTVLALSPPDFVGGPPFSGAALNNREMILFDATIVGP